MAQHRYRQNKIKREHTIIDGVLPILEGIAEHPDVQAVTPGRINQRTSNRNAAVTFQYRTNAGLKLLARSRAAVQEVFVVTDRPEEVLSDLAERRLIKAPDRGAASRRKSQQPGAAQEPPEKRTAEKPTGDQGNKRPGERAATERDATRDQEKPELPKEPARPRPRGKAAVGDAIDQELQEQMMSIAQKGTGAKTPAPKRNRNKPSNLWRDLLKTHQELLALEEPPHDLE